MKNKNYKKYKSLQNFVFEINETQTLISALVAQVVATRELLKFIDATSSPDWHKHKKLLEISDEQIKKPMKWVSLHFLRTSSVSCLNF